MRLLRWLRQLRSANTVEVRPHRSFRPGLEPLGDRLAPHAGFLGGSSLAFGAPWVQSASQVGGDTDAVATHFAVLTRSEAHSGAEARVTVIALDADNRPVRDYTGTVQLTSSDTAATLPAAYTFTASDHGRHSFLVTLATEGEQTITATDTSDATITGSRTVAVEAASTATQYFVRTERNVYTGQATRIVVAALDESNRVVPTYTGTVHFTSSDATATLPADYTFTTTDRGVHVFAITPAATGDLTVTATDTADGSVTGSVTVDVDEAPVATHFAVIARRVAANGVATHVTIVALSETNQIVRNYTGTVTLTSSDSAATLPAAYTFTAADRGVKTLAVTFNTTGRQTLTATDAASLTGTTNINVAAEELLPGVGLPGRPRGRR